MKALSFSIIFLLLQPAYSQVISITQLRKQLANAPHDTVRVHLYADLADQYRKSPLPDSTYYLATQGILLARKYGKVVEESRLFFYLGHYYKRINQYPKAQTALQRALRLAEQGGTAVTLLRGKILYRLATVYGDQGKFDEVVKTALASAEIAQQAHDTAQVCHNYDLIALAEQDLKNRSAALAYSQKSVRLARQLSVRNPDRYKTLLFAEENIAELYETTGQYARAYPYLKNVLNYVITEHDVSQISEAATRIAYNLVKQKRPQDALRYLDASKRRRLITISAEVFEICALAYQQLGQLDKALGYAQKSYTAALNRQQPPLIKSSLTTLIDVEKAGNRYKDAFAHYEHLAEINDTLFTIEKSKAVADIEARYQVTQKEQTIALLRKDAVLRQVTLAKKQNELTVQRQHQLLLGLVILGLLYVLSGLFFVFRHERNTGRLLAAQNEAIEQKAEQLQQANKLKDKLFGIIGHDLRSPIATLKVQLTRLKNGELTPQEFQQSHSRLLKMVGSVYVMLDNLLLWSLIQRKRLRVWATPLDLVDICRSLIDLFEVECEFKRLHLIVDLQEAPVMADEHQMLIVIRNVLQNAIKFTPPGGTIWLSSRVEQDQSVVLIQDSGVGMSAATLQGLTNSGRPQSGTSGEMGVGLGLEVCRELIGRNEGKMFIHSEPGKGTWVTLSWPIIKLAQSSQSVVAAA